MPRCSMPRPHIMLFIVCAIQSLNNMHEPPSPRSSPEVEVKPQEPIEKPEPPTKYVVYVCENRAQCNSLLDVQRGVITALMISFVMKRNLAVKVTYPCNISDLMDEAYINWTYDPKILHAARSHRTVVVRDNDRTNIGNFFTILDFQKAFPEDVIFVDTRDNFFLDLSAKGLLGTPYAPFSGEQNAFFSLVWNRYFVPKNSILEKLPRNIMRLIKQQKLVCVKVLPQRFWSPTCNFFREPKSFHFPGSLPTLEPWQFLSSFEDPSFKFFISTDNDAFRKEGTRILGADRVVSLPRKKEGRDTPCDVMVMELLEQIVLKNCKYLVINDNEDAIFNAYLHPPTDNFTFCLSDPFTLESCNVEYPKFRHEDICLPHENDMEFVLRTNSCSLVGDSVFLLKRKVDFMLRKLLYAQKSLPLN